jgi:hypothetical protein
MFPLGAAGVNHSAGFAPDTGSTPLPNQPRLLGDNGVWNTPSGLAIGSLSIGADEHTNSTTPVYLLTVESANITLDVARTLWIHYSASTWGDTLGQSAMSGVFLDGAQVLGVVTDLGPPGEIIQTPLCGPIPCPAGSHLIDIRHWVGSGTVHWLSRTALVLVL